MKKIRNFIQNFFSAFGTAISSLIHNILCRPLLLIILILVMIAPIIIVRITSAESKTENKATELTNMPPPPVRPLLDSFLPSDEPGSNTDFRPFNEPESRLSDDVVQQHRQIPDSKMLSDLHSANEAMILEMLKKVP